MYQLKSYGCVFMKLVRADSWTDPLKLLIFGVYFFVCFIRCADLDEKAVYPKLFHLEDYCNEDGKYDLSMIGEDIYKGQLYFKFKESMPDDFKCTVIIGSRGFDRDRLSFYFTEFDMGDNCGPGETWLMVGEGDMTVDPKPIPGLPLRLCGRTFADLGDYNKQFTTEWRHLRVAYHANKPPVGSGFSLIFQHFSDPPCEKWQFYCENRRCIDESLNCGGNNPCGDNSDCPEGLDIGAVIGIVVGCSVGLGVAVFLCKCLPTIIKRSDDVSDRDVQRTDTDRQMSEFLRRPYNVPPTERRDITTPSNDTEPPRYSSLQDSENKSHHSTDNNRDTTSRYETDIPPGGGSRQTATPSASTSHSDQEHDGETEDYMPPPPPYEMVVNYREMYSVSESQPTRV